MNVFHLRAHLALVIIIPILPQVVRFVGYILFVELLIE
jgi:hypothetical protein